MKLLLINPNRFNTPPVPPIGLEYLAAALSEKGHQGEILDLCFSEDPLAEIGNAIRSFSPDLVGLTVRNIDTVLFPHNEFFLDDIRKIVSHIREAHKRKVLIGGSGVLTNPEGVLSWLGADYCIAGPAEEVIGTCIEAVMNEGNQQRIFHGSPAPGMHCHRISSGIDYRRYIENGGIAGIETHKGCSSSCVYCIEAHMPVVFKDTSDLIKEIRGLTEQGISLFHLCDSEFNEDLDFALEVCASFSRVGSDFQWTGYLKPSNFNRKLFSEMKATGAYLITLVVDSWKKCPLYWSDVEKMVFHAKSIGIRVAIDFLAGFPYEDEDTLRWCLDFFRRIQPDSVGINTHIRLYKSLPISRIILSDNSLKTNLFGHTGDPELIKPVFYNHVTHGRLSELIEGDSLFRIEGLSKGVNCTRAGRV